jgi:glycyl-tRNA synthetase
MEMEYFVPPDEAQKWYDYWCGERLDWYIELGIDPGLLRLRPHGDDELSHYSSETSDVEFLFPWGWGELEGIANRGDYDLIQHADHSGHRLDFFDQATNTRYVPHVIEPAAGATRAMMAFLIAGYRTEIVRDEERTVLGLHPRIAPFVAAVLPLSRKTELIEPAQKLFSELAEHFNTDFDETQAIGKRYRRQDEIGTPYCVTYDFDSLDDGAVTIRDRDTMDQVRIPLAGVVPWIQAKLV